MHAGEDGRTRPRHRAPGFTLRQLECYLAVAEAGSVSAGAKLLHSSPSSVSDALTALELSLGTSLFDRQRSRGARLTSDGLAALPLAKGIMEQSLALTATTDGREASVAGRVRMGFAGALAKGLLPTLLSEARVAWPELEIEYLIADMPELLRLHEASELDLIVTYDTDTPPGYTRRVLGSGALMVVVAASHPLATEDAIDLTRLVDDPLILLDIAASRSHTFRVLRGRGVSPLVAYRTADPDLCRSLIGRGLGFGMLVDLSFLPDTDVPPNVLYKRIVPPLDPLDVVMIWRAAPLPPRVNAVVELSVRLIGGD
jgi:DNA-binding transcriptional LysR family regulator